MTQMVRRKASPRYGEDIVQLQQGHKDPSKSATDKDNIIPQYQFCNRVYCGDFTLDYSKLRARLNQ